MTLPIAAVLIVRDEEPVLARALRSLAGHVREAIVLDTGSRDRTAEIAEREGAHVRRWAWRDHFAAARNESLRIAQERGHRWALVVDADDEIEAESWAGLARWLERPPGAAGLALVENAGAGLRLAQVRVLELEHCRYEGRIHEQVISSVPCVPTETGLRIVHHGYTPQENARKDRAGRNVRLLRQELEEGTTDARRPHLHYHLARSLRQAGTLRAARPEGAPPPEHDDGHPLCHYYQALRLAERDAPYLPALVRDLATAHAKMGAPADALAILRAGQQRWPDFTDLVLVEAAILADARDEDGAVAALVRCLELGDADPRRYTALAGGGSYLPRHHLGRIAERRGDLAQAREHYAAAAQHHELSRRRLACLVNGAAATPPPIEAA